MGNTPKNQLTQEHLQSLFFLKGGWLYCARSKKKVKGSVHRSGYRVLHTGGKQYRYHNVVWNLVCGIVPEGFTIDHINRKKHDNRISNLRLATGGEQIQNQKIRTGNKSGYKGVYFNKNQGLWHAQLWKDGRNRHVGFYACRHEAAVARGFQKLRDALSA